MIARLSLVALVLGLSVVVSFVRAPLAGVESPSMAAWPGHVIFGLYFAALVLALQGLFSAATARAGPRQLLLLLMLAGLCLDLVLVNVQEVTKQVDASYGMVVLWDMATFFIWLRAIELCAPENEDRFYASSLVAIVPLLKLGREVLFLPYPGTAERAYLDLAIGDGLVCLWALTGVGARPGPPRGFDRALTICVFAGCVYWLAVAAENILSLAWPPLPPLVYDLLDRHGLAPYTLNFVYLGLAVSVTLLAWCCNLLGIGERLGLTRRRAR